MKWFILLMLFSGVVQAKGYKCKNAEGKTTYQQSPCRGNENVDGYKHYEESEATKTELAKVAKVKEEKRIADADLKKQIELEEHEEFLRYNRERLSNARANLGEAETRNANAVADYNRGVSDRVHIKNRYLDRTLNKR